MNMEQQGFIELEMGTVEGREKSKQPWEALKHSYNGYEPNSRTEVDERLQRGEERDISEVTQSSSFSLENASRSGSDKSPSTKVKRESGLRSKRGGKALKIYIFSQEEEAERRRARYVATVADNAPLYPLDLRAHGVDSCQDEESDKSSIFSPEVAANGFGSPIELPSKDSLEELTRRQDEMRMQVEHMNPLDQISLISKFDSLTTVQRGRDCGEDLQEGTDAAETSSGKSLTLYVLKTLILILGWYTLSTALTLYNKLLLGKDDGKFPLPLLMNTIHFSMQAFISMILVRCNPSMHPPVHMSWRDYFLRVVPAAVATALDVNLTNVSLVFVTITFVTMCKSGAPIFILIFAFLFKLEVPSYKLLSIILIISTGVMLTVTKETDFNITGFLLVMLAAVMSGFRWTVTQLLLQKEEYGLKNPFAAMSVLTPVMAAVSFVLSLILEPWRTIEKSNYFDNYLHALSSFVLMLLGGALAFFMVSTEYVLLSATSAVTLTVAGMVKEFATILVAVVVLKDQFTLLRGLGFIVIIVGVSLYNLFKYQKMREGGLHGDLVSHGLFSRHNYMVLKESKSARGIVDDSEGDIC